MADAKIPKYSLSDLKNSTDDALGNYLRGLSFKQDNSKLDFRLAVGYTAVVIAAATFVADYKLGWEATKTGTAVAVAAYAILNAVYTYWMWSVEKGLVFEGSKDGKQVSAISVSFKVDLEPQAHGHGHALLDIQAVSAKEPCDKRSPLQAKRRSTTPHTTLPSPHLVCRKH
jgi:ABC-type nickel/cobalt efflux system permease component RcnA